MRLPDEAEGDGDAADEDEQVEGDEEAAADQEKGD